MSDRISEKIDQYTKSNIKRLRTAEEQSGRKLTKYDIAQQMLSEGKLSQSDFSSWMNTREGYDSYTLTNQEKQALKKGSIWSFNNVSPLLGEQSYLDTFRNDEYIKEPITGIKLRKTPSKTQTSASSELKKESEIRKSVVDLLLSNAEKALLMLKNYHNGIGYVSSDAFVQGMNVIGSTTWDNITGRDDFVTVFENESELEKLIANLKSLKSKSTKPMEFAQEFKKIYGIEFDAKNFEKLSEVSTQINELGVYENLSKYFEYGINKIETSDASSFGPAALLAPIFGDNIAQAKEYIDDLRRECKDETELKEKLKLILIESKQEADKKLKEYNPSKLENEYKQAYKEAMGKSQSDEVIEEYIQIQKMNAMVTKVGGTIALALLSSGSSTVLKAGTKAVGKFGAKIGGQVMKAGMTATMAAVPAAETIVGGLTSKDGLTAEKGEEAWEELKNGLMYGSFGAYVSGPLGNLVSKVLSKNPQIFSQIVASQKFSLGAGAAMETTADVLFDRITSDMTFKESMAQNGIMNFGMMFVGARVHNDTNLPDVDLSQVKIEKMRDGSFNLKANGKVFFKAKNENELALVTLALGAKLKSSQKAETPKGQSRYKIPSNISLDQIMEKLNLKPELKSNPICELVLESRLTREDFSAKKKKVYLKFLDIVLSNEVLANNKSLQLVAKRGLLFINDSKELKFFEEFVNNPELHNNKYVSAALWRIIELLNSPIPTNQTFITNVIKKYIAGDISVVSDIMKNDEGSKNYYSGIPLSFANKQVEDLSQHERDILRNWIYATRESPLSSSSLLSGIFPAVPITSEEFISVVQKLNKIDHINTKPLEPVKISEYKNNLLNLGTGKLEQGNLVKITSLMPEIFNNGKEISAKSLRQLRQISSSQDYNLLSEKDKCIVNMAVILQDTNDDLLNLSRKAVDIAQRFGFNKYDSEKIANIICCSNLILDFMKTNKDAIKYEVNNNQRIITNSRREFFDNVAFVLKDGNTFELAKIVYSSKDKEGITRNLDKMLTDKIREYKSHDFMMPQTPRSNYRSKARMVEVKNAYGKTYNVRVVKRSEIENFGAYLHTPENVSMRKDAYIKQNIAKFMLAGNTNLSERIVCACYVDGTSKSFVNNRNFYGRGNGLILNVANNKQYVGAGSDISSLEKERKQLIQSYFNKNDLVNTGMNVPEGTKMNKLRTLVSDNLKKILGIDDDEYIRRMDKIKEELGDEVLSMERLREIDPKMADAYKEFLSARISNDNDFNTAVLRDDYEWNEFLISEGKISDFYTTHLDRMPDEYLEIASNPDNDIVIVLMYE